MSKITTEITAQGFELIRDRIGFVLADEIAAQVALPVTDPSEVDAQVFVERVHPIDKGEVPLINVLYSRTNYISNTAIDGDGRNTYNIDVYARAKSKVGKKADKRAMLRLERLLGMIRAILESPHYVTLDFPRPFIMNTTVTDIQIADPKDNQDSANLMMGRLVFVVDAAETVEQIQAVAAAGYDTQVKIEETDKGFLYVIDN